MRARLRWTENQWVQNVDHCCMCWWACSEAKKKSGVSQLSCYYFWVCSQYFASAEVTQSMLDEMVSSFLNGMLGIHSCFLFIGFTCFNFDLYICFFSANHFSFVYRAAISGTIPKTWMRWLPRSPTTWKWICWRCSKIMSRKTFRRLSADLLVKMCQQMWKMLRTELFCVSLWSCVFCIVCFVLPFSANRKTSR